MVSDTDVVETAATAAEGVITSTYKQSQLDDLDVTVAFEDGILDIDIYVNPPADADADPEQVIEEAVEAAHSAVDELFESADKH